jgi:hypothetical protein
MAKIILFAFYFEYEDQNNAVFGRQFQYTNTRKIFVTVPKQQIK